MTPRDPRLDSLADAIEELHYDAVQELLKAGVDPNGTDSDGMPLLFCAIDVERDNAHQNSVPLRCDITALLLSAGASSWGTGGETDPLAFAIFRDHELAIDLLRAARAAEPHGT